VAQPSTAASIADVVERLRAIEASAARSDGVACFARLYREVTEAVGAETAFADRRFLERLDLVFANRFFDALDATSVPPAWAPLFEARGRRGIAPLQFALAGMNAHINFDLPLALVTTCDERGVELRCHSPEHADFELVNTLLERVEERIKRSYLTGPLRTLDRIVHRCDRIDDVVAMWDVRRARDAAWTNAEMLWSIRGDPALRESFVGALGRSVGFAGRGLLIPSDTLLARLSRLFGRS
jgi:hypothetical protein